MVFRKKRKSIDKKTLKKVYTGLVLSDMASHSRSLDERRSQARTRMLTKLALDNMWITDRQKRQKIHKIVGRIFHRIKSVHNAERSPLEDWPASKIVYELEAELGGKEQRLKFFREYQRLLEDLKKAEKEITEKQ